MLTSACQPNQESALTVKSTLHTGVRLTRSPVSGLVVWFARRRLRRAAVGDRAPQAALVAGLVSVALTIATAALGPSAAVPPFSGVPPLGWHAQPSAGIVTGLLVLATVSGGYAVLQALAALRRGWQPPLRHLVGGALAVVVALVLLAPLGSADPGSYAAYGRLAATGHNPYATPPSVLTGSYGAAVEAPWRTATSIYGPLATGEQWLAARIAGGQPAGAAHAVVLLDAANGLAFVLAGLLLLRLAGSAAARRRVAVMFCANPLLLLVGVAGGHLDVIVTAFVAAALLALRGRPFVGALAAGVLGGAASAVKASAALAGLGLAWAVDHRHPRSDRDRRLALGALLLGAALVLLPGYALAGSRAFDQLHTASGFVSFADPWRLVTHPLEVLLGHSNARLLVRAGALVAGALLALLLARGLPGRREPALVAARSASVLMFAWLLTAPYVLPWYALPVWALLALLPASGYDRVLAIWTTALALAYLPGRQVPLPGWLHGTLTVWKSGICPPLLAIVTLVAAGLAVRRRV